jgi:hypothetical protein
MLLVLTTIVTVTGLLLRETRLTAARFKETEDASRETFRIMELIRRDVERAIGLPGVNLSFAIDDLGGVQTDTSEATDILVEPGTNSPVVPTGGLNAARLSLFTLAERTGAGAHERAATEVSYWLAAGPSDAFATLVRAERRVTTNQLSAYTNFSWYMDTTGAVIEPVARFVTVFSVLGTSGDWTVRRLLNDDDLPTCFDIHIEYLPESAARRLRARGALTNLVEIERCVTKTSIRVFPPNRRGYLNGR